MSDSVSIALRFGLYVDLMLLFGLALFAAWLRESEARVLKREAQALLQT